MAAHDFAEFSWDEQEDVKAVLASRGRELSEFTITDNGEGAATAEKAEKADKADKADKAAVRRISVTCIANGKAAVYETDHFAPWITDFDAALQAGEFDD